MLILNAHSFPNTRFKVPRFHKGKDTTLTRDSRPRLRTRFLNNEMLERTIANYPVLKDKGSKNIAVTNSTQGTDVHP